MSAPIQVSEHARCYGQSTVASVLALLFCRSEHCALDSERTSSVTRADTTPSPLFICFRAFDIASLAPSPHTRWLLLDH